MTRCFFVSDLHGRVDRYRKLFQAVADERPSVVLLGGDLLPAGRSLATVAATTAHNFIDEFLAGQFERLKASMGSAYPRVLLIPGNDDPRSEESALSRAGASGLWDYIHQRHVSADGYDFYGYACVPPTPFLLKDWERYDVSRHVDLGCLSPEEGIRTIHVPSHVIRHATIADDLERLVGRAPMERAVFLFHAPPYRCSLDRAALDGRLIDHAPVDPHVGSIAISRFIERRQPLLTLHGHIHEAPRITGAWTHRIGRTICLTAAHDGPELALVRVILEHPDRAVRVLI